jgi:uncharacterized membrane protein YgcG
MTIQDPNKPAEKTPNNSAEMSSAEKSARTARKVRNAALSIWAYVFYGAIVLVGILVLIGGSSSGLVFIGIGVALFALYWLFGYVICCR